MADPTSIDFILQQQSAANQKQLRDDAAIEREEEGITTRRDEFIEKTKSRVEEIKTETEQIREENKKNKLEASQKAEVEKNDKETLLKEALEFARGNYAVTEYKDRTALQEIRKFFGGLSAEKEAKEIPNISAKREEYKRALNEYKEYKFNELQSSGLNGEAMKAEIGKLLTYFNLIEAKEFYDAKSNARINYLDEKEGKGDFQRLWDGVRSRSTKIVDGYNKNVPTWVKAALFAGSFIPGASTFVLGKRTWGAFMMAAAGGMQVDALAQWKDERVSRVESQRHMAEIIGKGESVNFEALKKALDGDVAGIDKKIRSQAWRSNVNKFIAIGGTIIFGAGTLSLLADIAHGDVAGSTEIVGKIFHGAGFGEATSQVADVTHHSAEHASGIVGGAKEAAQGHLGFEKIPIKEGDGIRDTLFKYIEQHHPEIEDREYVVTQMVRDFQHDNPGKNLNLVFKSNSLLINDHNGFHITGIAGNDNWGGENITNHAKVMHHHVGTTGHEQTSGVVPPVSGHAMEIATQVAPAEAHNLAVEVQDPNAWNQDVINGDRTVLASLDSQYAAQADVLQHADDYSFTPEAEKLGKIDAARKHLGEHLRTLIEGNHQDAMTALRKDFFDGNAGKFKALRSANVIDAINNRNGVSLEGFSKKAKDLIQGFAKSPDFKPRNAETFENWTRRIVRLTNKT